MLRTLLVFLVADFISFSVIASPPAYADETGTLMTSSQITVSQDTKHDVSIPLRDMPALSESEILSRPFNFIPLLHTPPSLEQTKTVPDGALQTSPEMKLHLPLHSFQGVGVGLGSYRVRSAPADPNGSVGLTQYVQWVNTDFAVFNKATGQVLAGFPKPGNAIWSGFGGLCETANSGDPVVKYDQLANRWVLTQLAFTNSTSGPFFQCFAVSTTGDATGSYNRYAFQFDSFNDYGKLGLWPDAYYMTFNMFGPVSNGPKACAFDRNKMLAGQPATMQCKQLSFSTSGTLLPADLDGQITPPSGNPEYFLSLRAPSTLKVFKFHVDFVNPSLSTLTGPTNISVAPFTIACASSGGDACAIQPNTTTQLDTVSDRLMHRLSYRQFTDYASMIATHTVQGPAPKNAPAIRWYELRFANGSTTPTLYQQATHAPDSKNRFMGSIAMDKFGNIVVGYSVTSTLIFPSIEFASRNVTDPLNTLPFSQPLVTGQGSQINNLTRWGDYSATAIDPVDDCTFWNTNMYLKTTGSYNWSTFISSFKLAGC